MEPKKIINKPQVSVSPHRSPRKSVIIAIVIIIIAFGFLWWLHMKNTKIVEQKPQQIQTTPQERIDELKKLEAASKPVTTTPTKRITEIKSLEKSSKKVTEIATERLNELKALSSNKQNK